VSQGVVACESNFRDQENDGGAAGLIHTPYDGSAKPFTIGLTQLDPATWIDVDDSRDVYLAEKRRLYAKESANVLVAEAGTEDAQREVYDLLSAHLALYFPKLSRPEKRDFRFLGDDGKRVATIAVAGLLVQEDLVIMRKSDNGWRLVAASLCFPSAWNLREKFGKPLHDVHGPVPGFNQGTRNANLIDRMFDNLKPGNPVLRWNWSLYGDARLYHPVSDHGMAKRFGDGDISGKVILRLERQTLRKLPQSGDILFTIRIYLDPLEVLETHADGAALVASIDAQLQAMTEDEIAYKGFVGERERLSARLAAIGKSHGN
jgi:dimethylamine monooxygenase subunit A